jgi:hypothetical protein
LSHGCVNVSLLVLPCVSCEQPIVDLKKEIQPNTKTFLVSELIINQIHPDILASGRCGKLRKLAEKTKVITEE